jgi:hypothetical protein
MKQHIKIKNTQLSALITDNTNLIHSYLKSDDINIQRSVALNRNLTIEQIYTLLECKDIITKEHVMRTLRAKAYDSNEYYPEASYEY